MPRVLPLFSFFVLSLSAPVLFPGTLIYKYFNGTKDTDAIKSIFKAHGATDRNTIRPGACDGLMPHSTLYWATYENFPANVQLKGGGYDEYDRNFNLVATTRAEDQQENDMIRQQYGF